MSERKLVVTYIEAGQQKTSEKLTWQEVVDLWRQAGPETELSFPMLSVEELNDPLCPMRVEIGRPVKVVPPAPAPASQAAPGVDQAPFSNAAPSAYGPAPGPLASGPKPSGAPSPPT